VLGELTKWALIGVTHALDVGSRNRHSTLQSERLFETFQRLRQTVPGNPRQILGRRVGRGWIGGHPPSVARLDAVAHAFALRLRNKVDQRLAVLGHERVEVDQVADPIARAVGDAGCDHPAVAVPDQHEVAQLLALDYAQDILDMGLKIV
jgi:hypothetical protein